MQYQIIAHQHIFPLGERFDQCHASNIALLPNEEVACVWFAGSKEGADDVKIYFSKTAAGRWEEPRTIASYADGPCWNPVLLVLDHKLMLFYKTGKQIPKWKTYVKTSEDLGDSWSEEEELVPGDEGGRGPVKNKCLRLGSGRILAPASRETSVKWSCFVDISDDGANTWRASQEVPAPDEAISGLGFIQPTLWEDSEGMVHMLMRSSEGYIYESESFDEGESWSMARRTSLPNNNCGIDLATLGDGRLILVYNPVSANWGPRSPISFSLSEDNGRSWSEPVILDHVPAEENIERAEFSYPSVITSGNDVHISYTWKRLSIAYWHLRFPDKDSGVARNWVTMITPYDKSGKIDYNAVETLVDWYIEHKVEGIFAVCQSSEMFYLSLSEREELARFILDKAAGRIPVVISGHVSDSMEDQLEEIRVLSRLGADAFVLATNRLAAKEESDDIWISRAKEILERFPDVDFGLYECPYPYKRLLSPAVMKWCVETDRFTFLKDTSCDINAIREKVQIAKGSRMKIFNANSATLLESLRLGADGYSGVMNNFYPELYAYLIHNRKTERQVTEQLQSLLTVTSLIESAGYPVNAKYTLNKCGVPMTLFSRSPAAGIWNELHRIETDAARRLMDETWKKIKKLP